MDEDWLTVVDAAFRMTQDGDPISWRTISKYRDAGRIPSQDQGGIGLVRISDVLAYEAAAGIKREEQVNNGVMKTDALLTDREL
jgi:hypothetical protein